MFRGQLFKGSINPLVQFVADSFLIGIAARARQTADFGFGIIAAQDLMTSLAPAEVDREVGRDTIEPSRKARSGLEFGEVFVSTNKGLLCQLNRIILIVHNRLRDPNNAPLVAFDQNPK